jgi:hypothetical protein
MSNLSRQRPGDGTILNCLLTNPSLSYLEMYTAIAHIARKFDMQLHETTAENVSVGREMGLPFPEKVPCFVKVKVIVQRFGVRDTSS